jgi:hypothetical protein
MAAIVAHPRLQGLRRFGLVTRDAQDLYARYGFGLSPSRHFMEINRPSPLRRSLWADR